MELGGESFLIQFLKVFQLHDRVQSLEASLKEKDARIKELTDGPPEFKLGWRQWSRASSEVSGGGL